MFMENKYNIKFKKVKIDVGDYKIEVFINEDKLPLSWYKDAENFVVDNILNEIILIIDNYIKDYEDTKNIKTNITFEDIKQAYLNIEG